VPLAAGLLQGFKFSAEAVGCDGCAWGGFGEIACELGALADFVQLGGGVGGLRGHVRTAVTSIPIADERDEVGLGERERAHGGESLQQLREDAGEFVTLLIENLEQVFRFFIARALEVAAETAGVAAQSAVRGRRDVGGGSFGANEVALDIDVADLAGGLAQALEQAEGCTLLLVVRGKAGEQGEQDELGLNAAGGGAKAMDGFGARIRQAGEHGGLQRSGQFAEGLYGARR
jgi:hypothetical protein